MESERLKDKIRGSLIGGAIGDALGYPVEFVHSFENIRRKYGDDGVMEYDKSYPWLNECFREKEALFSDDTQMSLYTAEGIIEAEKNSVPLDEAVCNAYLIWMGFQQGISVTPKYDSHLAQIQELNQRRAPGATCLSSLESIHCGIDVKNSSKGCGGVIRMAPVGMYGASHHWALEKTASIAGRIAELTHHHPMSTYASAALAVMVQMSLCADEVDGNGFRFIVSKVMKVVDDVYGESAPKMNEFKKTIEGALNLAESNLPDWEIIEDEIGGGWIAEETLAIAVFSVLRHVGDFNACVVCAVNHGGDSDSTGAVAGNIIGAIVGYDAIPGNFTESIQLRELMVDIADKLCGK